MYMEKAFKMELEEIKTIMRNSIDVSEKKKI